MIKETFWIDIESYPLTYKDGFGRDIMFAAEITLPGGPHECVLSEVHFPDNPRSFDFHLFDQVMDKPTHGA